MKIRGNFRPHLSRRRVLTSLLLLSVVCAAAVVAVADHVSVLVQPVGTTWWLALGAVALSFGSIASRRSPSGGTADGPDTFMRPLDVDITAGQTPVGDAADAVGSGVAP